MHVGERCPSFLYAATLSREQPEANMCLLIAVVCRNCGRNSDVGVCTRVSARAGKDNFWTTVGQLLDNYTLKLHKSCAWIATPTFELRSPAACS